MASSQSSVDKTLTVATVVETADGESSLAVSTQESATSETVSAKRPAPDDDEEEEEKPKDDEVQTKKRKVTTTKSTSSGSILSFFKPKEVAATPMRAGPSAPGSSSPAPSTTVSTIDDLERRTMAKEWRDALEPEFKKAYFIKLKAFVTAEFKTKTVYPPIKDVYSWSRLTRLHNVKVVVVGQDPYHQPGQAHGLSFSVKDPVPPPPSLKNIYKQVATDFPDTFTIPKTGDLTPIAKQGVLWLNTSLTVRRNEAASHSKKGWETFTTAVLKAVLARKNSKGVVFLAWGRHAQNICKDLKIDQKKHLLLQSAHPSPLSAHNGFFGNGHFKKTNAWLETTYGEDGGIDWSVLNPATEGAEDA